jgi:hypothetical protein
MASHDIAAHYSAVLYIRAPLAAKPIASGSSHPLALFAFCRELFFGVSAFVWGSKGGPAVWRACLYGNELYLLAWERHKHTHVHIHDRRPGADCGSAWALDTTSLARRKGHNFER